ncbi:hypothetical protein KEJ47_09915 [Candidatus Bathyarchaeota archaeon]|nr:hypothetical protein [Candidatus Bathyarchaeota archaeon]
MGDRKTCFQRCEYFRCGQRALILRGKSLWCRFADDECEPKTCKYAQCVRGRLLPDGVCGLAIPVKSIDLSVEDIEEPIRVSKKLASKLKDDEFY